MENDAAYNRRDLTGMVFHYLTVIGYAGTKEKRALWTCKCKCGATTIKKGKTLLNGTTKSCGCYNNECRSARVKTHGMRHTSEYGIWTDIKKRCYNEKNWAYSMYGGRGIFMCDEWKADFMAFYNDMGARPALLTIDRIDNNGPYCKDNCKWATRLEQGNNKRNNVKYEFRGEYLTVPAIARIVGIRASIIIGRISTGWDFQDAISLPRLGPGEKHHFSLPQRTVV